MNAMLDKAITLAVRAHGGQLDKGGQPYILHVLRVMIACNPGEEQIVGVLHDVVEDTYVPKEVLQAYFGTDITEAVLSVSRIEGETYKDFIRRVKKNRLGRAVKIRDIEDNLRPERMHALPVHEWEGMRRRYRLALDYLTGVTTDLDY